MIPVDVDLSSAMREHVLTLRTRHVRVLCWRSRIASWIVGFAAIVAPCGLKLEEDEPPAQTYDVHVEKVGHQQVLRIGDRGVRLDKADARHIGGLLECSWVGSLRGQRAHDVA